MTDLSAADNNTWVVAMTATNAVLSLDANSAQRLVRLLGMLGSAHDGEVANAGRMPFEI
jgi:hypothetical protein